jgi:small GTP-binding protein
MTAHKAILCGGVGVGKSALARVLIVDDSHHREVPTLGSACFPLTVRSTSKEQYSVTLWDTAGQEQLHEITGYYFHGASVVIAVCDLTRADTLSVLERAWLPVMRDSAPADAQLILVGNKSDCIDMRKIDLDELIEFSEQIDAFGVLESSAKTNEGVVDLRQKIGDALSAVVTKATLAVEDTGQEGDTHPMDMGAPEEAAPPAPEPPPVDIGQPKGKRKGRLC